MNLFNEAINRSYLEHSAKGQTWNKHKYIAIKNGRYIYPEDLKGDQHNQFKRIEAVDKNKQVIEARKKWLGSGGNATANSGGPDGHYIRTTKDGSAAKLSEKAQQQYSVSKTPHEGAKAKANAEYKKASEQAGKDRDAYIKARQQAAAEANAALRSRQINDQINSAHSNATSSTMDLTPGSELKKRAEERKASTTSTVSAETSKIAEEIKRRNTASVSKPKEKEKTEETTTTETTSTSTTEEKKGTGRKGSGGGKKSSSKASTASTPNTPEAKELGMTEDDFTALGLTEPVASREEAIEKLAMKVIHGDFGNGADRKAKLGQYYNEVQKKVNEFLKKSSGKKSSTSSDSLVLHSDEYSTNVLCHYGVLGMKWGIRRYQPYPFGHTGGKEVGEAAKSKKARKKITPEQKANIKTAAAVAGSAAAAAGAAAGAAKLYKMDKRRSSNVKNMSTEELKSSNQRAVLEREYLKNRGKSNLEKAQYAVGESSKAVNQLRNQNRQAMNDARKNRPRMDLSHMTDQQLRERINRENLERQYNDLFAPKYVDPGRERAEKILDIGSNVLAIGGSALSMAVAIKMLSSKN